MQQFARAMGFLYLGSGALLLAFPKSARRIIRARAEFARLSPGALRLLGISFALGGATLVAVTTTPAVKATTTEGVVPELRKAA